MSQPNVIGRKPELAGNHWEWQSNNCTFHWIPISNAKGCEMNKILFLCNRNLCSSRVAEALFNQYATRQAQTKVSPNWQAESRGFAVETHVGPFISPNAIDYLESQAIFLTAPRPPLPVESVDLLWADVIVALHEKDHRPIIESQYPLWANRVEFWNVPDFHESNWGRSLAKLEANVLELISIIRSGGQRITA